MSAGANDEGISADAEGCCCEDAMRSPNAMQRAEIEGENATRIAADRRTPAQSSGI